MTTTDFFRLIIKTFGVYCFIDGLFTLIPNMSYSGGFSSFTIAINTVYLIIISVITYILLFQTDGLIKLFKLEKGFDNENIDIKEFKSVGLFKFAIIIIGLVLITNNIGQFLEYCYLAFKKEISAGGLGESEGSLLSQSLDYGWWAVTGINILIGVLLLTNYKRIAILFVEKEKNVG